MIDSGVNNTILSVLKITWIFFPKMWLVVYMKSVTWRALIRNGKIRTYTFLLINNFSTTYARKIYVNLDIDYTRSLIQKFSTMSTKVQIIKSSNLNNLSIEEQIFLTIYMDIKELLEAEIQEYNVTGKSRIIGIDNYFG
ncbi:hypothetical protein H5410_015405 [Solanum commersonii]|uniref:Uncharacterized protein n=1 Tax=Solanum commersonii TaxID=4109 RepID=A0A9J5ZTF0_SOLCO|nr:hypothetical protein H5410_015405 [Solanum commersonii]